MMITQHWLKQAPDKYLAIVSLDLCRHMESLSHNELSEV